MNERRKILEFFEEQKDSLNRKINDGIEKHRKGNAEITVTDRNGNALKNAKVTVTQKGHEFRFGANIFMLDQLETEEKNEAYKKYFSDIFNMATLPFYWDSTEPEKGKPRYTENSAEIYRRPPADRCMRFCEEHGIEPREHALAYEHFFPKWLCGADTQTVKAEYERRCREISQRYSDKIKTIEVTNEMGWPAGITSFYDEPDYIEWCFKTAEKYFPSNKLSVNECTFLAWEDNCRTSDKYYSYIEANMSRGARIDAVGMQYHIFCKRENEYEATRKLLDPKSLYKHMDMYATLGKPLQITEVTVPAYSWNAEDEEIQAEIIEKLYSVWFSHPSTEQIIYWNLVDGYAYVEGNDPEVIKRSQGDMSLGENYFYGGLLRFDMTPKPAYYKIKELLQKTWHTEIETETDRNGTVFFRGFFGKYDIKITVGGKTVSKEFSLSSDGCNDLRIVL